MKPSANGTAVLAPVMPPRQLPALRLVTSPRLPRRIAKALLALLGLAIIAMLLAPWQQSVRGSGQVVAYAPLERQQTVQANIYGRIYKWGDGIQEGVRVTRGQVILEIRDLDPAALERLELQRDATRDSLKAEEGVMAAYQAKLEMVREAQRMAIAAAEQEVEMAKQKVAAEQEGLIAAQAAYEQSLAFLERKQQLLANKLASKQEVEIAERQYREAHAKLKQAEAYLAAAKNGLTAKESQLIQKQREAEGYIETSKAEYQQALSKVASAQKELAIVEGKLAKQQTQIVEAPRDGTIVRLLANEGGEIVKSGDPLFVLVPETAERAVEIWIQGNDAPLVSPGRHVRLQFEGWPAVQFVGWPSVAVGTFGGQVVNVDAVDDGKGQFRILVRPAEGEEWPSEAYLRQGVRANGWVLLNQVKLGYEVWRQLNGFPPVISPDEPKDAKGAKPPKVKM
ncbi:MAG TPA: HlyD family efflux transporter periplasmic adaptor subunit [Lacipirellulaceae bacterium]|nr:HlyD family efflux transporter periplasmic adaptor subunit [Lacipirellulaceae bacterium]